MIEGQLDTVLFTNPYHTHGLAVGRSHGLLTVNSLDTRPSRIDDHGRMQARPGADAHDVELLLGEHLAVVLIDMIAAIVSLKGAGVLQTDVRKRHDLGVGRGAIAFCVLARHARAGSALCTVRSPTADDTHSESRHPYLLLCLMTAQHNLTYSRRPRPGVNARVQVRAAFTLVRPVVFRA